MQEHFYTYAKKEFCLLESVQIVKIISHHSKTIRPFFSLVSKIFFTIARMIQNFVIERNATIMITNSTMTLFAQVIQYLPKEIIKSLIRQTSTQRDLAHGNIS